MCGIAGIISKIKKTITYAEQELFNEMLMCSSVRGYDSTGVFSVSENGNADYLKLATHPFNLINSKEYSEWKKVVWDHGKVVVGHTRKATEGEIINKNAHPFVFGNTILVHNGNVDNFRSLLSHREREKHEVVVSSHAACILLVRNEPEKILSEMKGAFTFVWYDVKTKKLQMIRNDERPMYLADTDDRVFFASEGQMLKWLLERRGIKASVSSLKPNVLLTFNLEGDKIDWDYKPVKSATLITNNFRSQSKEEPKVSSVLYKDKEEIPESEKYNIHYGNNEFVKMDNPLWQQIIFTVDDYRLKQGCNDEWDLWGHALDSDAIEVVFTAKGKDKDIEELAYAVHLIGLVKSVRNKKFVDRSLCQEIQVSNVHSVDLTTSKNGVPITEAHMKWLLDNAYCQCNASCSTILLQEDACIEHIGPKTVVTCSWCVEAEQNVKTANPSL